jgi:hypothetical protein
MADAKKSAAFMAGGARAANDNAGWATDFANPE